MVFAHVKYLQPLTALFKNLKHEYLQHLLSGCLLNVVRKAVSNDQQSRRGELNKPGPQAPD